MYKAQWRVQTVAVKMLSNTTAKQMEAFKREALILEDLKDTNIVQVLGLSVYPSHVPVPTDTPYMT